MLLVCDHACLHSSSVPARRWCRHTCRHGPRGRAAGGTGAASVGEGCGRPPASRLADRELGIAWVEQRTGVKAVIGGSHPGVGTCNALLSLGGRQYLEIIAPDPAQTRLAPQYERLTTLETPRLITWAAAMQDAQATARRFRAAGSQVLGPSPGSRQRPDGKLMRWTTLALESELGSLIPFFIEWDTAVTHPAADSPAGCRLREIAFTHPQPDRVREALLRLGIEATVNRGADPSLTALLDTPSGRLELL